jgi:hypothetical protein
LSNLAVRPTHRHQAAGEGASLHGGEPDRRAAELERALGDAQLQVAALAGEVEAARRRSDDMSAMLGAAQAAQRQLAAANEALRAELDRALAADQSAAAQVEARLRQMEQEMQGTAAARDAAKQVGRPRGPGAPARPLGCLVAGLVASGYASVRGTHPPAPQQRLASSFPITLPSPPSLAALPPGAGGRQRRAGGRALARRRVQRAGPAAPR